MMDITWFFKESVAQVLAQICLLAFDCRRLKLDDGIAVWTRRRSKL